MCNVCNLCLPIYICYQLTCTFFLQRKSNTPNSKKAKIDTSEGEEKADEDEKKEAKADELESKSEEEKTSVEAPLNNGTTAEAAVSEEEKKQDEAEKKEEDVPPQQTQETGEKVSDNAEQVHKNKFIC